MKVHGIVGRHTHPAHARMDESEGVGLNVNVRPRGSDPEMLGSTNGAPLSSFIAL